MLASFSKQLFHFSHNITIIRVFSKVFILKGVFYLIIKLHAFTAFIPFIIAPLTIFH